MTDTMTSQNIDLSSWDTQYKKTVHLLVNYYKLVVTNAQNELRKIYKFIYQDWFR